MPDGSATTVGEIVGCLRLDRSDWVRGIRETQAELDRLNGTSVKIRIDTNAASTIADLRAVQGAEDRLAASSSKVSSGNDSIASSADKARKPVISLAGALTLLAPAAAPIGAVATGALAGLVPTLATVGLGISGVSAEFKSGALDGTKYGRDINALTGEFSALRAISAGGLLSGLDRGLESSRPLFREVNTDVEIMSTQIGDVAAHAGPALLTVLTGLNPIFVVFGNLLTRGAGELEHWAQSSTGVSSFVEYVQQELPEVLQFIGNLVVLFGHVAQASANTGGIVLSSLGLIVRALDALPIGVLQTLIPLLLAARLAMLGYRGVSAIVDGIKSSYSGLTTKVQGFANQNNIASLQVQASAARTSATVASNAAATQIARLTEAETAEQAARETVIADEQRSEAAGAAAREILAAKVEETAAIRAAANEAVASAVKEGEASEAAAARVVAAGRASALGWDAAAGPIGALVLGLGFLGAAFFGSSEQSEAAAQANATYAESVKQSTDALNKANVAATVKNLSDDKSLDLLDTLTAANGKLGISYNDLARAVNGSDQQFGAVIDKLGKMAALGNTAPGASHAAQSLIDNLETLRSKLSGNIEEQTKYNAASRASQQLAAGGSAAARAQAAALGLSGSAYLAAQTAAKQNTGQTKAQTAAFIVENNAAGLLQAALDGLAGVNLSVATAQTSLASSNLQVKASFKDNGDAIDGNTAKAVSNQQAIQGNVEAAQQLAVAIDKQTNSSKAGVQSFKDSRDALVAQLKAQGDLTPAVQAYIDKLYDLKNLHVPPTKLDVDTEAAKSKAQQIQDQISAIRQGDVPGVTVNTFDGQHELAALQAELDALHDKTITVGVRTPVISGGSGGPEHVRAAGGTIPRHATGGTAGDGPSGTVVGAGTDTSDNILVALSPDEEVIRASQARKHRGLLKAINAGIAGFASGGTVTGPTVYRVGKGYGFEGEYYSKLKDANAARTEAIDSARAAARYESPADAAQTVDRTINLHGVTGIATILRSQIPASKSAMADLSKAVNEAFRLDGTEKAIAALRTQLTEMKQYESGVESTVRSGFDTTQYGSIAGIISGLGGATKINDKEAAEIKKLRKEGLNKSYLNQLIASGDVADIDLLAGGTQADITKLDSAIGSYNGSVAAVGDQAVVEKFGKSVDQQEKAINRLVAREKGEMTDVRRLAEAVTRLTHRPTVVELDGKEIAHSTEKRIARHVRHKNGRPG